MRDPPSVSSDTANDQLKKSRVMLNKHLEGKAKDIEKQQRLRGY